MVEAWSYAGPYTIEANGTSGNPVTPPPSAAARRLARLRISDSGH